MKIGIISINMYSKGLNFACPLHNYAFQQFLLKNGIDSTIIDYKPVYFGSFDMRHPYDYYAAMCNDFASNGKSEEEIEEWKRITELRDSWRDLYQERERRYDKFQNFIDSNYIKTKECYDSDLLEIKDPGFDCYICCTDVIWKKEPDIGFDRGFFLACKAMENKWKISYAASRGVFFSENEEDEKTFLGYVRDIDAISVREDSLKRYLEENIENKVTKVLDPVLLHDKEFYDEILVKPQEDHYVFLYYVMEKAEDTIEQAVNYARANNFKIVEITDKPLKDGRLAGYEGIEKIYNYDMGIEEWLGYIKYADCVFTNSFHACCLSILFEKQLYIGSRNGDKVTHLLEMFDISYRRINKKTDIITNVLPDINYEKVRNVLKEKQKESSDFILSAILNMERSEKAKNDYEEQRHDILYPICYNSGAYTDIGKGSYNSSEGEIQKLNSGAWGLFAKDPVQNNGGAYLYRNRFSRKGYLPDGWKLRVTIDKRCFWYLEDESLVLVEEYDEKKYCPIRIFKEGEEIPYISVNHISLVEVEAVWKKEQLKYSVIYSSGLKLKKTDVICDASNGSVQVLDTGIVEYKNNVQIVNDGKASTVKNLFSHEAFDFTGWRLRVRDDRGWHWYLKDGSLKLQGEYSEGPDEEKCFLKPNDNIPYIASNTISEIILEAVWSIKVMYYGGVSAGRGTYRDSDGKLKKRKDNSWEFFPKELNVYDNKIRFHRNEFDRKEYLPDGWRMRVKTSEGWKWYMEDGTLIGADEYKHGAHPSICRFLECDIMPVFSQKDIIYMVAEALWKKGVSEYKLSYCSGLKSEHLNCHYDSSDGEVFSSDNGFMEYRVNKSVLNDGSCILETNKFAHPGYEFIGWRVKVKAKEKWYWYLENKTLRYEKEYCEKKDGKRCVLREKSNLPYIPASDVSIVILEGMWRPILRYLSGSDVRDAEKGSYEEQEGKIHELSDGVWEFIPDDITMSEVPSCFYKNKFSRRGYLPDGWKMRFKIGKDWYWYLKDNSAVKMVEYDKETCPSIKTFPEYAKIPVLKDKKTAQIAAEALWKKGHAEIRVIYNSARKAELLTYEYDETQGKVRVLDTGTAEYNPDGVIMNNGNNFLICNGFVYPGHKFLGWRMRIKDNGKWYWYLEDGSYRLQTEYNEKKDRKRYILKDGAQIPYIPSSHVAVIVLEGIWRIEIMAVAGKLKSKVSDKIKEIRGRK